MADAMFDTNVFIGYFKGDPGAKKVVHAVLAGAASGSISSMTTLEIWQFSRFDRKQELIYNSLSMFFEEVPIDHEIAALAGKDLRPLSRSQRRNLMRDALIVESAKIRGEPVYTRDRDHFTRFGATVLTY